MPITASESPAWNMMQLIRALGGLVEGSTQWAIKVNEMPSAPDQIVMIRDTGGPPSEVKVAIDYPTIQILVRGKDGGENYAIAYDKAKEIWNAIVAIPSRPAAYEKLTSVTPRGHIVPIGTSDNNRPTLSMNFQLITWDEATPNRDF